MNDIEKMIEGIIKINIDFISNKDGINREDSNHLPKALTFQLVEVFEQLVIKARIEREETYGIVLENILMNMGIDLVKREISQNKERIAQLKKELKENSPQASGTSSSLSAKLILVNTN